MINTKQLKEYVIEPSLDKIELNSPAAVNLLLGTAAVESNMGEYIHQVGGGPALSIYQIEPKTHESILKDFLQYKPNLEAMVIKLKIPSLSDDENLLGNLFYATAIARIKYYWCPKALPDADDVEGLARYWRNVYNSPLGAFEDAEAINKFIAKYNKFVLPYI